MMGCCYPNHLTYFLTNLLHDSAQELHLFHGHIELQEAMYEAIEDCHMNFFVEVYHSLQEKDALVVQRVAAADENVGFGELFEQFVGEQDGADEGVLLRVEFWALDVGLFAQAQDGSGQQVVIQTGNPTREEILRAQIKRRVHQSQRIRYPHPKLHSQRSNSRRQVPSSRIPNQNDLGRPGIIHLIEQRHQPHVGLEAVVQGCRVGPLRRLPVFDGEEGDVEHVGPASDVGLVQEGVLANEAAAVHVQGQGLHVVLQRFFEEVLQDGFWFLVDCVQFERAVHSDCDSFVLIGVLSEHLFSIGLQGFLQFILVFKWCWLDSVILVSHPSQNQLRVYFLEMPRNAYEFGVLHRWQIGLDSCLRHDILIELKHIPDQVCIRVEFEFISFPRGFFITEGILQQFCASLEHIHNEASGLLTVLLLVLQLMHQAHHRLHKHYPIPREPEPICHLLLRAHIRIRNILFNSFPSGTRFLVLVKEGIQWDRQHLRVDYGYGVDFVGDELQAIHQILDLAVQQVL